MTKSPSSMRLFALPLTSSRYLSVRRSGTQHPLIYYYAQMPKAKNHEEDNKPSLLKRAQDKASQMWTAWGKAQGGWKLKVHTYGEKVVDKIDFEELALASIDTSLGPKLAQLSAHDSAGKDLAEKQAKTHSVSIPLIYPPSFMSSIDPLHNLEHSLAHRSPLHLRRTWFWVAVIPLTAPFALLPIVPNLPFFFCVWRAWTHWKAHTASAYLLQLVHKDAVRIAPSKELDEIYSKASDYPVSPKKDTKQNGNTEPDSHIVQLLPNPSSTIGLIINTYSLPKDAERSLLRAVEQAQIRSESDEIPDED